MDNELNEESNSLNLKIAEPIVYEDCEWCFQFDNDEPYTFAAVRKSNDSSESPSVTFTLNNNSDSTITFSYNGRTFRMFARELTESGEKIIKTN